MNAVELSLILPVLNEQELLEETVEIFCRDLSSSVYNYEIVIVNDGSQDNTGRIAEDLAKRHANVRVIHNPRNLGSGKSLLIGFKEAKYGLVLTNFADRPFDTKELKNILPIIEKEGLDFIVITRHDRSANSFFRKATSLTNYFLIRTLFGVKVKDYQFVQIYKKEVIDSINVEATQTFVPPELIIKAISKGYRMREYKTRFYPRLKGKSKCGNLRVISRTLYDMLKFWWHWVILESRNG